jgi:hypothetical protein
VSGGGNKSFLREVKNFVITQRNDSDLRTVRLDEEKVYEMSRAENFKAKAYNEVSQLSAEPMCTHFHDQIYTFYSPYIQALK